MAHHAAEEFRFSLTVRTDDLALLQCLRALCHYCEASSHKAAGTAGASQSAWDDNGHRALFRFSTHGCRTMFLEQIERLLPREMWKVVAQNDHEPPPPGK